MSGNHSYTMFFKKKKEKSVVYIEVVWNSFSLPFPCIHKNPWWLLFFLFISVWFCKGIYSIWQLSSDKQAILFLFLSLCILSSPKLKALITYSVAFWNISHHILEIIFHVSLPISVWWFLRHPPVSPSLLPLFFCQCLEISLLYSDIYLFFSFWLVNRWVFLGLQNLTFCPCFYCSHQDFYSELQCSYYSPHNIWTLHR